MRRVASICGFLLVLGLTTSCEDENEQQFPFTYEELDEAPPEEPALPEAAATDAGADVVLVDASEALVEDAGDGDGEGDAATDAALEEGAEGGAAEDDGDGDGEGDGEDAGAPDEGLVEEGAGGTRDEDVFGGDGVEGAPLDGDAGASAGPAQGMAPGAGQRGPVRFMPVPQGGYGYLPAMPLYPGETFDVATLSGGYTAVVMKNVALRLDEDVNVFVVSLTGALVPLATGVVDLDRPGELQLVVEAAEVRISEEDLGRIFTRYLFEEEDDFGSDLSGEVESPLRDVEVKLERGRLVLRGELEESGDDVELRGTLEPTVSGDVAFIPTSLRRDEKPVDSLDDIFEGGLGGTGFGDDLDRDFGNAGATQSLWLDEDAIYFDPEAIVRAPELDADVIDVKTTGKFVRLLLQGNAPEVKTLGPPGDPENYVEMRGGAVRFGKVIMPRADLVFLDEDPSNPLDLSLQRFDEQVIAGDTRIRPDLGVESTLPDFEGIPESAFEEPDGDAGLAEGDGGDEEGGEEGAELDGGSGDDAGRDEEVFE